MRELIALKERKRALQTAGKGWHCCLCTVFPHDETTFFLVDKVSPLIEKKQQDFQHVFLTCWCWTLKAFQGPFKKIQLQFIHFSRFIYLCFLGCSLVFFLSLPEVKRGLTHHLSRLLGREQFSTYHKRCEAWPVVTLAIKLNVCCKK